ncbi:MAG: MlaD family protein, partial [Cyanobacteria bacterium]|nr:MlaD family protein [Cyanobacteriota bacterium]
LSEDSPVKYNGVQVGKVVKIELNRINPQEVKLLLNIVEGTPITASTSATLISQGITGVTYVGLSASSSILTPLKKRPQDPYPVIPSKPSLFNQLDHVLKEVSENVNAVSLRLKEIFNQDNSKNLKKSLANIEVFTHNLASHDAEISRALKNSDTLFKNLSQASKDLPDVIIELKQSINKLTTEISEAGQNVSATMKSGKVTLDKISEQTLPPAVSLLHQLNNIAANLEKVSTQMRQNPSVIIRGSAPAKPGPGE